MEVLFPQLNRLAKEVSPVIAEVVVVLVIAYLVFKMLNSQNVRGCLECLFMQLNLLAKQVYLVIVNIHLPTLLVKLTYYVSAMQK
jgi:hypothetical protein